MKTRKAILYVRVSTDEQAEGFSLSYQEERLRKYCALNNIEVIGLLVGARGTITTFFENFRKQFGIPKKVTEEIVIAVIRGSYQIYHNHVYNLTET